MGSGARQPQYFWKWKYYNFLFVNTNLTDYATIEEKVCRFKMILRGGEINRTVSITSLFEEFHRV